MARPALAALLLPVVGALTGQAALAACPGNNPAGTTLTSTQDLSTCTSAETYTNNGEISTSLAPAVSMHTAAINSIVNNGNITSPDDFGLYIFNSSINSIVNAGTIPGGLSGIYAGVSGSGPTNIGTLTNSGSITGYDYGVGVGAAGRIDTIVNTGTITAYGGIGVVVDGSIGTIDNSGTISGSTQAILSTVTSGIGVVNNSGLISGNIAATGNFQINGASSGMGTLTGYGASGTVGTITITSGDLTFGSGNLLLNDNVSVVSHTLANTGANLYVSKPVTITGAYTQSAGASLNVNVASGAVATGDVASDSGYGRLVVSGAATIASGSAVNLKSQSYAFAGGQRFVVVRANAVGTDYNDGTLIYSADGFAGTISGAAVTTGSNTDLVVTLSGGGTSPGATIPNAISSLGGLQSYSGTSDLLTLRNASLAIASTAEANRAGEQLSPAASTSAAGAAATTSTFDMLSIVGSHIASLRGGEGGPRGMAAGDAALDWGAWGQAFGGRADQGTIDQVSGYRAYYGGFVAGIDGAVTDSWRLGGALSYTRTNVDGRDNVEGSHTGVDSYGLTAYASYTGMEWYANLYLSGAQQSYRTRRMVDFTGFSALADGDFNGQQVTAKAEIGYPIALTDRLTLTPLAELGYSYSRLDGYTETAGNGAALKVDASDSHALRSGIGGKLATRVASPFGEVVPFIQAMWLHQYNDDASGVTARYAADPVGETAFTSFGAKPIADMADLTLGATLLSADDLSVTTRYGVQLAPEYTNQTLSLRLRQLF